MRHGEVVAQAVDQRLAHRIDAASLEQRHRQPMHLGADVVVLLAEADQLGELDLELTDLVAQCVELALGERDCLPAMLRVGHGELGEQLVVLAEKIGVRAQVVRDIFGIHSMDSWRDIERPARLIRCFV